MNIELTPEFKAIAKETYRRQLVKLADEYRLQAEKKGWRVLSRESIMYHFSDKTTYMDRDLYNYILPTVKEYIKAKREAAELVRELLQVA